MLCARCFTACFARLAADLMFAMVIPESIQKSFLLMMHNPEQKAASDLLYDDRYKLREAAYYINTLKKSK
jgi:hypothetical protein